MNPSTKHLVVVRDSVKRVISDYAQVVSKKCEMKPFEQLLIHNTSIGSIVGGHDLGVHQARDLLAIPHPILSNRPVSMVLDISDLTTAWKDSDFITDCLCWHNVYRQRHGSPALSMSSELCYLAQTWANHLAHTNRFYYRYDKDIGQNLFCRPSNVLVTDVTGQEVATYWYRAVRQYDFNKEPDILHANVNAGHFTQLVWAASRHFGVGKARSRSGKIVVVAHYAPAGNISGAYLENVLPPSAEYFTLPPIPQSRFMVPSESSTPDSARSISGST
ncbi:hypothetical protein Zmor_001023 [Zophobas morio]|uniref:SCP domain-containing protein n=1 Tax=Zophobas morio TaxID=2755281 RepID=A0AA38J497_9CUCU|nr:hypothetical protein Zmor_001023 [Zophobas morio]